MRSEHMVETRGRNKILSKEEVFDFLSDKRWHTVAEVAEYFEVCRRTASIRITELIADGWGVINGREGIKLVEATDITDEEEARAIERMVKYIVGIVTRQAMNARPMKRLVAASRKLLPKNQEERLIVRKYLVQLTHLIDWQEIEDME